MATLNFNFLSTGEEEKENEPPTFVLLVEAIEDLYCEESIVLSPDYDPNHLDT